MYRCGAGKGGGSLFSVGPDFAPSTTHTIGRQFTVDELDTLSSVTRNEFAMVWTHSGEIQLTFRGPRSARINLETTAELLAHTHPLHTIPAPSYQDIAILQYLGQETPSILVPVGLNPIIFGTDSVTLDVGLAGPLSNGDVEIIKDGSVLGIHD